MKTVNTPAENRENLLRGLKQTVKVYESIEEKHRTEWFNSPESAGMLTDGVYAGTAECHDPAFFRFTGGEARALCYDLGEVCAAAGVRPRLLSAELRL